MEHRQCIGRPHQNFVYASTVLARKQRRLAQDLLDSLWTPQGFVTESSTAIVIYIPHCFENSTAVSLLGGESTILISVSPALSKASSLRCTQHNAFLSLLESSSAS
eukprot:Filipodium_phascolosomae@DN5917_c0_g1_i1.p1